MKPQTRRLGRFTLAWGDIESGKAYRLPKKLPVGGGLQLVLSQNRGTLDGEFLGSVKHLNEAIQAGLGTTGSSR